MYSDYFNPTEDFDHTHHFTPSNVFSKSHMFTKSNVFLPTDRFSKTSYFTKKESFTQTTQFTHSKEFSSFLHNLIFLWQRNRLNLQTNLHNLICLLRLTYLQNLLILQKVTFSRIQKNSPNLLNFQCQIHL